MAEPRYVRIQPYFSMQLTIRRTQSLGLQTSKLAAPVGHR